MPTAVWPSPNSFAIAGAATEMPVRSMYVMIYIRPISRRTNQRVLLGLEVVFPGKTRSGTELRVVSGIRSGAVGRGILDRARSPLSRPIRRVRGGRKVDRAPLFRRLVCGLVDLHYHPGMLRRHQRLQAFCHALEKMESLCFHRASIHMIDLLSGHSGEGEFDTPFHRVHADVAMGVVNHDRPFGASHLNPGGREIRIGGRKHPAGADGKHTPVIQGGDNPYAIRDSVRRLPDFANFLSVHTDGFSRCKTPEHKVDVVGCFHSGRGELYAASDFVSEITRDVPAHQRSYGLADHSLVDRPFDISELRIKTLRISDGKQQSLGPRQVY